MFLLVIYASNHIGRTAPWQRCELHCIMVLLLYHRSPRSSATIRIPTYQDYTEQLISWT